MANADQYRQMIDEDFKAAPLTDAQLGEQQGINSYNQMVEPVNDLTQTGEVLRPMYSEDTLNRMEADKKAYEATTGRTPQSLDIGQTVKDVMLGSPAQQIPMLPPAKLSGQVQAENIPRLSEISAKGSGQGRVGVPKPGSTAPTDISEKALANQMARTDADIDKNLEGVPVYNQLQEQKYAAKLGAEEAEAASQVMLNAERQKRIEEQIAQEELNYREAQLKAQKQIDSIGPIDPDRVWKNRSMWSKMGLVIGSALQGSTGSDAGLKMIQQLVADDLQAQIKDQEAGIKQGQGMLNLLKPFADNKLALMKMANEVSMKLAENYGKYMKAGASRGAIPGMAIKDTMQDYTKELLAQKNLNNKNLLDASSQQQKRMNDDEKLKMDAVNARLAEARLKFDSQNMSESDAKRLEGATAMAISAKKMKELENDKSFDPTKVKFAISQYMQGKGVPGSLNDVEGEYVQNYANYFSYKRQALTGAAASDKEEERIKLLIAPDKTFSKKGIRLYQAMRAKDINGAINSMNPAALSRIKNIPEFSEFDINRGKMGK